MSIDRQINTSYFQSDLLFPSILECSDKIYNWLMSFYSSNEHDDQGQSFQAATSLLSVLSWLWLQLGYTRSGQCLCSGRVQRLSSLLPLWGFDFTADSISSWNNEVMEVSRKLQLAIYPNVHRMKGRLSHQQQLINNLFLNSRKILLVVSIIHY